MHNVKNRSDLTFRNCINRHSEHRNRLFSPVENFKFLLTASCSIKDAMCFLVLFDWLHRVVGSCFGSSLLALTWLFYHTRQPRQVIEICYLSQCTTLLRLRWYLYRVIGFTRSLKTTYAAISQAFWALLGDRFSWLSLLHRWVEVKW